MAYQKAMAEYQQAMQAIQAVEAANAQKQKEFSEACALIKSDGVHGFKIDIEADSTIAPDEEAEKEARTQFLQAFIPLMEQLVPIAQGNPAMASMVKEVALFGVRAFPVARSLEETIEKAFDAIAQMPPHPSQQGKPPSGADSPAALQVRIKEIDSRQMIEREKLAAQQQKDAIEATNEQIKIAAESERDRQKLGLELGRAARQDAISGARLTHIESRDAARLT